MKNFESEIVVIGAGPVGLFAIFQAGMLGMKCNVIDALSEIGGQCTALYPEKPIYDIPAMPKVLAGDLIDQLQKQAAPFHPEFHLGQSAVGCIKDGEHFVISTDKGTQIRAKAVIIAAGAGAFGPNKPPIHNIDEYEGRSVFYYVKRPEIFNGKKIVIAGGGDSAVDWAINLSDIAEKVYLVHRRDKFRAAPASLTQLDALTKNGKIELCVPCQLHSIEGRDGFLEKVKIYDFENNIKSLSASYLLPFYGLSTNLESIKSWGLDIKMHHIEINKLSSETNIPGIYAVGDVATYPGKLKLILTGFAEVATALHHSYSRVFDGKTLHFEHSTSKKIEQV